MHQSQFIGCIVGLAVGDALGYPAEFRRRGQMLQEIGPSGIEDFIALKDERFSRPFFAGSPNHSAGTFTDDTQMTIAVAESLLAAVGFDDEQLGETMGRHFVEWSRSAKNNRAPGGTCMAGCNNLLAGAHWRVAGLATSKGSGSAMRVAPIGLMFDDLDRVEEVARLSSLPTHRHAAALEGAAAAALLVAMALKKATPEEMYSEINKRCSARCREFARVWHKVPDCISHSAEDVLIEGQLGEAWVAEEAVASAMYCFWRFPADYRSAVLTAINTDGDSDTIGTITGSILGARLGIDAIPIRWRNGVEETGYLHELGARLWMARCQDG